MKLTGPNFYIKLSRSFINSKTFFTFLLLVFLFSKGNVYAQLSFTTTVTDADCPNNGRIQVNVSGQTGSVNYRLIEPSVVCSGLNYPVINGTVSVFNSLCPGNYTVEVTDSTSSVTKVVTVTDNYVEFNATNIVIDITDEICVEDGIIDVSTSAGKAPYSFTLSGGTLTSSVTMTASAGIESFTGLGAGDYSLEITDNCGVIQTRTPLTVENNTQPLGLFFASSRQPILSSCDNAIYNVFTGNSANFTGAPPYTFEAFDSGNNLVSTQGPTSSLSAQFDLPTAGQPYTFKVTDKCGEEATVIGNWRDQSSIFTRTAGCAGFEALFIASNTWSPDGLGINIVYKNTLTLDVYTVNSGRDYAITLPYGSYTWVATNACGDTKTGTTSFAARVVNLLRVDTAPSTCLGYGKATFVRNNVFDNLPQTWELTTYPPAYASDPEATLTGSINNATNGPGIRALILGDYIVELTDACGNKSSQPFTIDEVSTMSLSLEGVSSCPTVGNVGAINYIYNNNLQGNTSLYGSLVITDSNGVKVKELRGLSTTGSITDLVPGDYNVSWGTGSNSCGNTQDFGTVTIEDYVFPSITNFNAVTCSSGDVQISGEGMNGIAPYDFTVFNKTNDPSLSTPLQSVSDVSDFNFPGLTDTSATYAVRVVDDCGNADVFEVTVEPGLSLDIKTSCSINELRVFSDRVVGATYVWLLPDGSTVNGEEVIVPFPLQATDYGTYSLTVTLGSCISETMTKDINTANACPVVNPCDAAASGNMDTDGDNISDVCDLDDDNDGILDTSENCPEIPGSVAPQSDALSWTSGGYSVFVVGGNTNALGYQESGYQQYAYQTGKTLTVLNTTSDFTFTGNSGDGTGNTGQGTATASTGTFSNGTLTYTSNLATNDFAEFTIATPTHFTSGEIAHGIHVRPELGLTVGDEYAVNINFTIPVTAFSFDWVDIFDTFTTNNPVLRYEIRVEGTLLAYIEGATTGDDVNGTLSVYDSSGNLTGTINSGQNTEDTFGFVTNTPISNMSLVYKVTSGSIQSTANDPHGIDNFVFSTDICDTDGDGVPDHLDNDSDNDGCPDAIEGDGNFTYSSIDTRYSRLTATVNSSGVPGGTSQGAGTSVDENIQSPICNPCNAGNPKFQDFDGDGVGNICDEDDDNDGIIDGGKDFQYEMTTDIPGECTQTQVEWFHNNDTNDTGYDAQSDYATFENTGSWRPNGYSSFTSPNFTDADDIVFGSGIDEASYNESSTYIFSGVDKLTYEDAKADNDYVQVAYTPSIDMNLGFVRLGFSTPNSGLENLGKYFVTLEMSTDAAFTSPTVLYYDGFVENTDVGVYVTLGYEYDLDLIAGTKYYYRFYVYNETNTYSDNYTVRFDDVLFLHRTSCQSDGDSSPSYRDTDSDDDGCPDAIEADGSFITTQLTTLVGGSTGTGSSLLNFGTTVDNTPTSNTYGVPIQDANGLVVSTSLPQETTPALTDLTINACIVDLSLTKIVDNALPKIGSNIVYTLTVTNNGVASASGVQVSDVLPTGLTYVSDNSSTTSTTFTGNVWNIDNLNVNQSITLQITATITGAGTIINKAEITQSNQTDTDSTPASGN
ncbi:hypothetical protein LPB136_12085 [Tenacibaculum todarodis]|uniref:DUF11 domain-containing protein n=1 Tax=Tenacibaculum todarodis TaxID=1850252 RepID=A0A1L3JLU1_9FLAO|nr:DUF11 domain-containing protein [Tenacibaculum todarodis]APG66062.1 hypothetical protein LPB136_12085 [Tenacibaculum todarodis]